MRAVNTERNWADIRPHFPIGCAGRQEIITATGAAIQGAKNIRQKRRLEEQLHSYINQELNRFLQTEKPQTVYMVKLPRPKAGGANKKINHSMAQWQRGYIRRRLMQKCREQSVELVEVPGKGVAVECSVCGGAGSRKEGIFICSACGYREAEKKNTARNVLKRGQEGRIVFHVGSAREVLRDLDGPFDLVFIDADKRQYTDYYSAVIDKVRPGGVIVADDVLWEGKVIDTAAPTTPNPRYPGIQRPRPGGQPRGERLVPHTPRLDAHQKKIGDFRKKRYLCEK